MKIKSNLEDDRWSDADKASDSLLVEWAFWSRRDPDVQSFAPCTNFAIRQTGKDPISDELALSIDAAIMKCNPATRVVLIAAYMRRKSAGFSDYTILQSVREFTHEFAGTNN